MESTTTPSTLVHRDPAGRVRPRRRSARTPAGDRGQVPRPPGAGERDARLDRGSDRAAQPPDERRAPRGAALAAAGPRRGGDDGRARAAPRRRCWCRSSAPSATPRSSSPSAATTCAATPARSRSPAAGATRPTRTCSPPRSARRTRRSASTPSDVEMVGALPPIGTFVTNYKVHPFVGVIPDPSELEPNPDEVAARAALPPLGAARRLRDATPGAARSPDQDPHLPVDEHLIWGATARILGELLDRVDLAATLDGSRLRGDPAGRKVPGDGRRRNDDRTARGRVVRREDVSDITAPSIGPSTTIEREPPEDRLARHEQSDVDAMGLDKRRAGGRRPVRRQLRASRRRSTAARWRSSPSS